MQWIAERRKPKTMRRALIVRFGGIGDIILATPMMRLLSERYPGIRIDLLVQKGFADAVNGLAYVHQVIEFDKKLDMGLVIRLAHTMLLLRFSRYDLFLNLQPSIKTCLLGLVAAAPKVLTFRKDRRMQSDTGKVRHAVDDFVKTLAPLGLEKAPDSSLDFFVPESAKRSIDDLLKEKSGGSLRKIIVINPTARRRVNRWPTGNWARLIDRLVREHQDDGCVVVIGGKRDEATIDLVKSKTMLWERVVDLSCGITLKELGALLDRASVFITGDTGPMHIAAAMNTPLVCLSGAADPDRTGPLTPNSIVLIDRSLPCVPCQAKNCKFDTLPLCMAMITVDQVFDASQQHLAKLSMAPSELVK